MTAPYTADQLERGIANALEDRNMEAVVDILKVLVTVDARRAEKILQTIQVGMDVAARSVRKAAGS